MKGKVKRKYYKKYEMFENENEFGQRGESGIILSKIEMRKSVGEKNGQKWKIVRTITQNKDKNRERKR